MDKEADLLDWNHLHAFLVTVEKGSLSAAARALGLTQPTLSRQVSALETALSLMLFERNGKRLTLTDAGRELVNSVKDMGRAAERLSLTASGQRSGLRGLVRITASDVTSAYLLPEVIRKLRIQAPQISVEIVATDSIQDLMVRDADIAVRHVRPEQPNLVARLLREKPGHFYATQSYLEARGRPAKISDLAQHDWVAMGDVDRMRGYIEGMGVPLPAEVFRLSSENSLVAWEMVKAGMGIGPMDDEIAGLAPGLEQVLPDVLQVTFPVWLVTHREIHTSPRIRLVYDLLAEGLA
ncbi:LysR family transcriptional regulator [Sulfitobacter sp. JB4-11]|uniref:LysR family transcriptional regulator n=1 Tax=Sulfitobacter rhodophyticola TaxID=3238304 RepID=UPI0035132341